MTKNDKYKWVKQDERTQMGVTQTLTNKAIYEDPYVQTQDLSWSIGQDSWGAVHNSNLNPSPKDEGYYQLEEDGVKQTPFDDTKTYINWSSENGMQPASDMVHITICQKTNTVTVRTSAVEEVVIPNVFY